MWTRRWRHHHSALSGADIRLQTGRVKGVFSPNTPFFYGGGAGGSIGFSVRYQAELLGIWDLQNRDHIVTSSLVCCDINDFVHVARPCSSTRGSDGPA